jgi:hypothetical protein
VVGRCVGLRVVGLAEDGLDVGIRVVGRCVGLRVVGAAEDGLDEGFDDVGTSVGSRVDDGLPVVGTDEGFDDVGGPVGSGVEGVGAIGLDEGFDVVGLDEGFDVGPRVDGLLVGGVVGRRVDGFVVVGLDEGPQSTTVASFMPEFGMMYALFTILASTSAGVKPVLLERILTATPATS